MRVGIASRCQPANALAYRNSFWTKNCELGPTMFKQEYQLEFIDDAEAVFNQGLIAAAFTDEVRLLWG